jgi:hypothetical protein
VVLTEEPCPVPGAPDPFMLARFDAEGDKFEGCWAFTPDGNLILATPKDKPKASPDLKPVEKAGPKT